MRRWSTLVCCALVAVTLACGGNTSSKGGNTNASSNADPNAIDNANPNANLGGVRRRRSVIANLERAM